MGETKIEHFDFCRDCGGSYVTCSDSFVTDGLGYSGPPGHDHDDSCQTRQFVCVNGHRRLLSVQNACSADGCGWKGRETCWCHGEDLKLPRWPVLNAVAAAAPSVDE